ncbi:MAG: DUF370 domain-containing protein [Chloroflexi bacterium]|nr:DUF370 domain-containing protein [Chloroflexota bacterium]
MAINKAVVVISPSSAPAKRLILEARSGGLLVDATNGRKTKAVVIMDDGYVVLAPITPETIASRVVAYRRLGLKPQSGDPEEG